MEGSPILVTENVYEYRAAIPQHITREDVAIEVGCAEGLTTALIAQHAARVSVKIGCVSCVGRTDVGRQ